MKSATTGAQVRGSLPAPLRGPRIGRADRLAALGGEDPRLRDRPPSPRRDALQRFLAASDVADHLRTLPAALDDLAGRLAGVLRRVRAGRRDEAADAAALLALEELRARAHQLYIDVTGNIS